jgi:hypothetical protein
MDDQAQKKFGTEIRTPIDEALGSARQEAFDASMQRLGIDPAKMPRAVFSDQVKALDRALNQVARGKLLQAAPDFTLCSPLIDAVGLPAVCDFLAILRDLASGFALRLTGDATGALRFFDSAMARADRLRFIYSEIDVLYMQGKIGGNLARLTIAFSQGEIDKAETFAGNVQEIYGELEQAMGAAGSVAPSALVETLIPVIEAAVTFAELDTNSLDYGSAQRRLKAASDAVGRVSATLPSLPKDVNANYVAATLSVFQAMERLVGTAVSVVGNREPVSGDALRGIDQIYDLLFEAQRNANLAGPPGAMLLQMIRRLRRFADNLTAIVRPQAGIATRFAGPLFGLSLLVLMGAEYVLIKPNAVIWPLMMLGDLVAALIIAFSYGALKFIPLLNLYANVAGKARQAKN